MRKASHSSRIVSIGSSFLSSGLPTRKKSGGVRASTSRQEGQRTQAVSGVSGPILKPAGHPGVGVLAALRLEGPLLAEPRRLREAAAPEQGGELGVGLRRAGLLPGVPGYGKVRVVPAVDEREHLDIVSRARPL